MSPIRRYFGGSGEKVMASMQKQYGQKRGKHVFYATAASHHQRPEDKKGQTPDVRRRPQ